MTGAALLLGQAALLALFGWAGARLLAIRGSPERALAAATLAASLLLLALLVAGAAGAFEREVVLGLTAAPALGAGAWAAARRGRVRREPPRARLRLGAWATVLLVVAALALAWRGLLAWTLPPYAYDGITYHLSASAVWVQEERLVENPLSLCCAQYPSNGELLFAWPMLFLGDDRLADAMQLPFVVLGALAVAAIARRLGVSAAGAAAAGALFALLPVVLAQSSTTYVDVIFASSLLAALAFVLAYAGSRQPALAGLAGLAAGIALGTKATGIAYVGVLVLVGAGALAVARRRGLVGGRAAAGAFALALAGCLVTGSYWYARNAVRHGNPVHPFAVEAAGVTLFDGERTLDEILTVQPELAGRPVWEQVAVSWGHDLLPWLGETLPYDYEERLGGFGPAWPWLALPALGLVALAAARRLGGPAALLLLPVLAAFAVQPYRWWSRFTIVLAAVGVVALVAAIERSPRRLATPARWVAAGLAVLGAALATYELDPKGRGETVSFARLAGLVAAPAEERTLGRLFHPEYRWLDAVPEDAVVAVELGDEPRFVYPVFGRGLERRVVGLRGPASAAALPAGDGSPAYAFVATGGAWDELLGREPTASRIYRGPRATAYRRD